MIEHKEISREDVAHRAYELYVQRGEEPGKDVEDWVRAEKELGTEPAVTPIRGLIVSESVPSLGFFLAVAMSGS